MLGVVEHNNQAWPAAEMERVMKVQEVMLKAMAGKLKWWEATEVVGVTDRTMRRWRERLAKHGCSGLYDARKKRAQPPKRVPVELLERVLRLYQEKYFDLNVRHFHEKLVEQEGIRLSYTWVKLVLQGAGLVGKHKKRGGHRQRRAAAGRCPACWCTWTAARTTGFRMSARTI